MTHTLDSSILALRKALSDRDAARLHCDQIDRQRAEAEIAFHKTEELVRSWRQVIRDVTENVCDEETAIKEMEKMREIAKLESRFDHLMAKFDAKFGEEGFKHVSDDDPD